MGMYTQLVLGIDLREDTPEEVTEILRRMMTDWTLPRSFIKDFPDAELFRTSRWEYMLQCDSASFDWETQGSFKKEFGRWNLTVCTNLKNYNDEIKKLLDWLAPYIETNGFLGFTRYEEDDQPILIYNTRDGADLPLVLRIGDR